MLTATTKKKTSPDGFFNQEIGGNERQQVIGSKSVQLKRGKVSQLQLLSKLDAVRELERKRLARDLHDQMGQDLTTLMLGLRSLKKEFGLTPEINSQLEQLQVIVGQLNKQVHNIAWDLRPLILDDLGLQVALFTLLEKWSVSTGIKVNFQCLGLEERKLSKPLEIGVYRIIQEALTNISKHAEAKVVIVTLTCFKGRLVVCVTDDGLGFDVALVKSKSNSHIHLGLLGIQERTELLLGTCDILSAPNSGTMIRIEIPLYSERKSKVCRS